MSRNQNIQCQFRYWLIRPPMTGEREGPSIEPTDANAM
jgi:hypothetical protein